MPSEPEHNSFDCLPTAKEFRQILKVSLATVYNMSERGQLPCVINNSIIEVIIIKKLQKAFPEMDEFTLKDFDAEWRTARRRMLNLTFDSKW